MTGSHFVQLWELWRMLVRFFLFPTHFLLTNINYTALWVSFDSFRHVYNVLWSHSPLRPSIALSCPHSLLPWPLSSSQRNLSQQTTAARLFVAWPHCRISAMLSFCFDWSYRFWSWVSWRQSVLITPDWGDVTSTWLVAGDALSLCQGDLCRFSTSPGLRLQRSAECTRPPPRGLSLSTNPCWTIFLSQFISKLQMSLSPTQL
jgi:hypothetical protein